MLQRLCLPRLSHPNRSIAKRYCEKWKLSWEALVRMLISGKNIVIDFLEWVFSWMTCAGNKLIFLCSFGDVQPTRPMAYLMLISASARIQRHALIWILYIYKDSRQPWCGVKRRAVCVTRSATNIRPFRQGRPDSSPLIHHYVILCLRLIRDTGFEACSKLWNLILDSRAIVCDQWLGVEPQKMNVRIDGKSWVWAMSNPTPEMLVGHIAWH